MSDPVASFVAQIRELERRLSSLEAVSSRSAQHGIGVWVGNPSIALDATGRKARSNPAPIVGWTCQLWTPSTTSTIDVSVFVPAASAVVLAIEATILDTRPGLTPSTVQTVATTSVTVSGVVSIPIELPTSLWTPAASPAGSVVELGIAASLPIGSGTYAWGPTGPVRVGP